MALLAVDTSECLPIISTGSRWPLTVICPQTFYMFVIPMKEKAAGNVMQTYLSGILAYKGVSVVTQSNNGT